MTAKDIQKIKAKIERSMTIIGKERDKLREIYDELQQVLDPIDEAEDEFKRALEYIDSGIDSISQQV